MNEPVKSRIDFDETPLSPAPQEELKPARQFTDAADVVFEQSTAMQSEQDAEGDAEALLNQVLKPRRSLWRKLIFVAGGLLGISAVAQLIQWVNDAWAGNDWTALGGIAATFLILIAGVGSVLTEWRRLYRLRQRATEREAASALLQSHRIGDGRAFCEKLAEQANIPSHHPALQRWQSLLQSSHNDREVVTLYSQIVQPVLDEQARRAISRFAAESALMIAVSPLALVDMAFIAWRNIRLINRVAAIYGIELGYYSRLRLFKLVLLNIAFAGASELIREVGMDWLSQDITARLSARAAQGMGAGLLTARLGIKAMELCRPLPWIENDKPKLMDFRKQLLQQLKNAIPKGKAQEKAI
ncbi:YcjF family protein [Morganella psychrotolerans]|uniref:YcjF family protein n=1 Tax=Morganella psychrotolerans TaxID=368603 RepID=UPI0039B05EA6